MDRDGDGAVEQAEYEAVSFRGQPFAEVDGDGDGTLSAAELQTLIAATDPDSLHAGRQGPEATRARAERRKTPEHAAVEKRMEKRLEVRMTLEALRAELPAAGVLLPEEAAMKAAADSGSLFTGASREVLGKLETASIAAGIGFPTALSETALTTVPVVEDLPADPEPPPGGPRAGGPGGKPGVSRIGEIPPRSGTLPGLGPRQPEGASPAPTGERPR